MSMGWSAPSSNDLIRVRQPDTFEFNIRQSGDKHFNWYETADGYIVTLDSDGWWKYTSSTNTGSGFNILATTVSSADPSGLGIPQRDLPPSSFLRAIKASRYEEVIETSIPTTTNASQSKITLNNLVILASFDDHWDSANSRVGSGNGLVTSQSYRDFFDTVNYTQNGAKGSVRDYFSEISYGQLEIRSTVSEWLKLPQSSSYYAIDTSTSDDAQVDLLINDALTALNIAATTESGLEVSGNGIGGIQNFDLLTVIHSGVEQAYVRHSTLASAIWSQQSSLEQSTTFGASTFQRYLVAPSMNTTGTNVPELGPVVHNIGQYIGLAPLYEYGEAGFGIGTWGLMGLGAWGASGNLTTANIPVHPTAWSKSQLGYIVPTTEYSEVTKTLQNSAFFAEAHVLSTGNSSEYFMLEHRASAGNSFDSDLVDYGSAGVLIWHVNESALSSDPGFWEHPILKLEEADGDASLITRSSVIEGADAWVSGNGLVGAFADSNGSGNTNSLLYQANQYTTRSSAMTNSFTYQLVDQFSVSGNTATYDLENRGTTIYLSTGGHEAHQISWYPALSATKYLVERNTSTSETSSVNWVTLSDNTTELNYQIETSSPSAAYFRVTPFSDGQFQSSSHVFHFPLKIRNFSINYNTGLLSIVYYGDFDQTLFDNFDFSEWYLGNTPGSQEISLSGATASLSGATILNFNLTESQRIAAIQLSGTTGGDGGAVYLNIFSRTAKAANGILNSVETGLLTPETPDSTAPQLLSVTMNHAESRIYLYFDETIQTDSIDLTKVYLNNTTGENHSLEGSNHFYSGNVVTLGISEVNRARAIQISGQNGGDGQAALLELAEGALKDFVGNDSATSTLITMTEIPETDRPSLTGFTLDNRARELTLSFSESVKFTSTDFGLAIYQTTTVDTNIQIAGNVFTDNLTKIVVGVTASEVEAIDSMMGFDNPAKIPYLVINEAAVQDMSNNNLFGILPANRIEATSYTPKNRLRVLTPVGGERWGQTHTVTWLLNGGWYANDRIEIEASLNDFESSSVVVTNIDPSLETYQWDTTLFPDHVSYELRFSSDSGRIIYDTSASLHVDNTPPEVAFSYSDTTPKAGPVTITATFSENIVGTPNITLLQPGTEDVISQPMTQAGNNQVFQYIYTIVTDNGQAHIDGDMTMSLAGVLDESDPGNAPNPATNTVLKKDTIPPRIVPELVVFTNPSIVDPFSKIAIVYNEPVIEGEGEGGAQRRDAYSVTGPQAPVNLLVFSDILGAGAGPYTLIFSGIVPGGDYILHVDNVQDLHGNPLANNNFPTDWPGALKNTHKMLLTKGGRTRLTLTGGFLPYQRRVHPFFTDIIQLESDQKTFFGQKEGEFTVEIEEGVGEVRYVNAEVHPPRLIRSSVDYDEFRDELNFQMVSFPFNIPNWRGKEFIEMMSLSLGDYRKDYLLYYFDEEKNDYVSVIETTTQVGPGYGFWMANRQKRKVEFNLEGPLEEQVVAVDLQQGWNLVGNPFAFELDINDIYVSNGENRVRVKDESHSVSGHHFWYTDIELGEYVSLDRFPAYTSAWLYVFQEKGTELYFFRDPENIDFLQDFEPLAENTNLSKSTRLGTKASELDLDQGEPLPPNRPKPSGFNGSSDSSSGGGGGGGCFLR